METPSNSSMEHEESRKFKKLVVHLADTIDAKNIQLREMEFKYSKACLSLSSMAEEKNKLSQSYGSMVEEKNKLYQSLSNMVEERNKLSQSFGSMVEEKNKLSQACVGETRQASNIIEENEKLKLELEDLRKKLEKRGRDLENLEAHNIVKMKKVNVENTKVNRQLRLMKRKLQVLERLGGNGDWKIEMDGLCQELTDKDEEIENLESLNQALIVNEHRSNNELQQARKELITGLQGLSSSRSLIGIRRMGELDQKPFRNVCQQRFSTGEADVKSVELCSLWQQYINNPQWHPFKFSNIDGKLQETIDDDDVLKELMDEWGDEVYRAVTTALLEVNDCNPSGRYAVQELWNVKEKRKASLKEVIHYILKQLKTRKRRK